MSDNLQVDDTDREADSLGHAIRDLAENISTLVRKEVELAREETLAIVKSKLTGAGYGVIALVVAVLLLPFILLTLVEVLAIWMPRWAASLSTTGFLIIVGVIAVLMAKRYLKGALLPAESIDSLKEDAKWARNLKR